MRALAATVVFLACLTVSANEWIPEAVVRVQAGNQGGTGTLISVDDDGCGYVLTCKHVTTPYRTATARFRNGYESSGPVIGTGAAYDTAIFRIQAPSGISPIRVAEEPVASGADVEVFGYGGQYGPVRNIKLIRWSSPVRGYEERGLTRRILLDPLPESGDSGGPIIHGGQLVGIVSGYTSEMSGQRISGVGAYQRPILNLLAEVRTQYG